MRRRFYVHRERAARVDVHQVERPTEEWPQLSRLPRPLEREHVGEKVDLYIVPLAAEQIEPPQGVGEARSGRRLADAWLPQRVPMIEACSRVALWRDDTHNCGLLEMRRMKTVACLD